MHDYVYRNPLPPPSRMLANKHVLYLLYIYVHVWKDNGSPNRGVIFDIRRKTRWQYHRALKLVKRNKENIKAERRMANGLSGTGFWSDVKRILGHSKSLPKYGGWSTGQRKYC